MTFADDTTMPAQREEDVDQAKIKSDSKTQSKQGEHTPRRDRQYLTADTDNPLIVRGID